CIYRPHSHYSFARPLPPSSLSYTYSYSLPPPPPPSSPPFPYTTLFRSLELSRLSQSLLRLVVGGNPPNLRPIDVVRVVREAVRVDRKSTRLNSSHEWISYAVFCLKKKNKMCRDRTMFV